MNNPEFSNRLSIKRIALNIGFTWCKVPTFSPNFIFLNIFMFLHATSPGRSTGFSVQKHLLSTLFPLCLCLSPQKNPYPLVMIICQRLQQRDLETFPFSIALNILLCFSSTLVKSMRGLHYEILVHFPHRNLIYKYFPCLNSIIIILRSPQKASMDNSHSSNPQEQNNSYADDFQDMANSYPQQQMELHKIINLDAQQKQEEEVLGIDETVSRVDEKKNFEEEQTKSKKGGGKKRDLKDESAQNKIKETINRLTKNIITSKKEIVEEISTINKCQQENEKQIKYKEKKGLKYIPMEKISEKSYQLQSMKKRLEQIEKQKALEQLRAKEEQKKRKKQIYFMQKMERMQKKHIKKDRSKMKEQELEQRIIYQQKFKSRKLSPEQLEEKIGEEQIKILEDAFIQRIKDRLNMGKSGHKKHKSLSVLPPKNQRRKKVMERQEELKKYNKKIIQDNKFKQKILTNLKIRREKEHENKQKQVEPNPPNKRNYYSAPSIRLPAIERRGSKRMTLYEKSLQKEPVRREQFFSQYD